MGISQEELAERIGVSRQAVSKWERAESSPDTDNLIELAKVYGVSLDELLQGKAEESAAAEEPASAEEQPAEPAKQSEPAEHVHVGWDGIHVHDKNGTKVDIDRKHGIFVTENGEQKVYTDESGHIHKSPDIEAQSRQKKSAWLMIPYPILTVIAYLFFGYFNICGGWGFGWLVFLTIPIYYSLIDAITKRDANHFAYPVLAAIIFFILGFTAGLWHPGWAIFLTIPVYYGIVKAMRGER
jgi:transcriptional regulator with XRE-family HTH domain